MAHPRPRGPQLHLDTWSTGSRTVIAVRGDLDAETAPQLGSYVAELPLAGCVLLELDLAGVPAMGSVGLSELVGVRRWCEQRGTDLGLRAVQPSVWRVFEATGLDRLFTPMPGPAAAHQELALF